MLGVALLVFREVLEAALIVTIVAAATRGVAGRARFIGGGIGLGIVGAIVVALFAGAIEEAVGGSGQELFNA
ncbi:MAG TPA: iron permease, partial [Rudaea sp.]|nr:iron permease [Rudaea sp.]